MDERETLIIAQATIKAAAAWVAAADPHSGYGTVLTIAEAFERWVHEAPRRALQNQTDRMAPAPGTTVLPQPQAVPVQPQPLQAPSGPSYACPTCGKPMVLRSGPYGQFYGCTGFRDGCRGSRDISGQVKAG